MLSRRNVLLASLVGSQSIVNVANGGTKVMNSNDKKIVFIHRKIDDLKSMRTETGKEPVFDFSFHDNTFKFSVKIIYEGKALSASTSVSAIQGDYYSFFLDLKENAIQITNLRTADYVDKIVADGTKGYFLGRLIITSQEVIFGVNGRNSDKTGVINVERKRGEQVEEAIIKYSNEARLIIDRIKEKNVLTREIDLLECVCYLEAQVDLLTRLVLDNVDLKPSPSLEMLKYADNWAVYKFEKEASIKERFSQKERMRRVQDILRSLSVNRKQLNTNGYS